MEGVVQAVTAGASAQILFLAKNRLLRQQSRVLNVRKNRVPPIRNHDWRESWEIIMYRSQSRCNRLAVSGCALALIISGLLFWNKTATAALVADRLPVSVMQRPSMQYRVDCQECPKNVLDRGSWDFVFPVPPDACPGPLLDVDIAMNIRHTWRDDLTLRIKPPTWPNAPVQLFTQIGGSGDHFGSGKPLEEDPDKLLVLDDEAQEALDKSPCADSRDTKCYGRYQTPRRSMKSRVYDLSTRRAAGNWTLRVEDGAGLDSADVRQIQLVFTCELLPSPTPEATQTPTATQTLTASPTAINTVRPTSTRTRTVAPPNTATRQPSPTRSPTPKVFPRVFLPQVLHDLGCPPQGIFTDIAIVVDASTSMDEPAGLGMPRKIDVATDAAWSFIDRYLVDGRSDQVGIVLFNRTATQRQVLTRDRGRLSEALAVPKTYLRKGSQIHLGIDEAASMLFDPRFADRSHRKALLLISDGLVNPGGPADVISAANQARAAGIAIFVVGYGESIAEDLLRAVANPPEQRTHYYRRSPLENDLQSLVASLSLVVPCPDDIYWPGSAR